ERRAEDRELGREQPLEPGVDLLGVLGVEEGVQAEPRDGRDREHPEQVEGQRAAHLVVVATVDLARPDLLDLRNVEFLYLAERRDFEILSLRRSSFRHVLSRRAGAGLAVP